MGQWVEMWTDGRREGEIGVGGERKAVDRRLGF